MAHDLKAKPPKNVTPILLPSQAPELNLVENIWQYLRQNWCSNRILEDYDAIIEAACGGLAELDRPTSHHHFYRIPEMGNDGQK